MLLSKIQMLSGCSYWALVHFYQQCWMRMMYERMSLGMAVSYLLHILVHALALLRHCLLMRMHLL